MFIEALYPCNYGPFWFSHPFLRARVFQTGTVQELALEGSERKSDVFFVSGD